jgi:hypothetical protein
LVAQTVLTVLEILITTTIIIEIGIILVQTIIIATVGIEIAGVIVLETIINLDLEVVIKTAIEDQGKGEVLEIEIPMLKKLTLILQTIHNI